MMAVIATDGFALTGGPEGKTTAGCPDFVEIGGEFS